MLRKSTWVFAMAMLCSLSLAAQTVDEIIAKHVEAVGGMDKLKAVNSVRMSGKFTAGNLEATATETKKRPNMVRQELTLQGMTQVQAYDGKNGWQIDPFQGKKTAEAMSEDNLRAMKENADFDDWAAVGALIDYKAKGHKVELLGKEDVEGTPAYKLKITLNTGDVKTVYLDADNYVPIKQESKRTIRGAEREFESSIGDYKEEGGVMMAHSVEFGPKGSQQRAKVTLDKVEINPDIPDSYFHMPADAAPASTPPAAPGQGDAAKKPAPDTKKPADAKKPEAPKDKPKH